MPNSTYFQTFKSKCIEYTGPDSFTRKAVVSLGHGMVELFKMSMQFSTASAGALLVTVTAVIEHSVCAPFIMTLDAVKFVFRVRDTFIINHWNKQLNSKPTQKEWMIEPSQVALIDKSVFIQKLAECQPEYIYVRSGKLPEEWSEGLPENYYFSNGAIFRYLEIDRLKVKVNSQEELVDKLSVYQKRHVYIKHLFIVCTPHYVVPADLMDKLKMTHITYNEHLSL